MRVGLAWAVAALATSLTTSPIDAENTNGDAEVLFCAAKGEVDSDIYTAMTAMKFSRVEVSDGVHWAKPAGGAQVLDIIFDEFSLASGTRVIAEMSIFASQGVGRFTPRQKISDPSMTSSMQAMLNALSARHTCAVGK